MKEDALGNPARKRCEAMIAAGIKDPESDNGKRFCTDKCPYEFCRVFERIDEVRDIERLEMNAKVVRLLKSGKSTKEVAKIMGCSQRTVERRHY